MCIRCIGILQHFGLIFVSKQWLFSGERSQMTMQAHTWWRFNLWFIHKIDWFKCMRAVHTVYTMCVHGISDTFYMYYLTTYSFNVIIYNETNAITENCNLFVHGQKKGAHRERRKEEKSKPTVQKDQYAATGNGSSSKSPVNEKRAQKDEIANKCTLRAHMWVRVCRIICFSFYYDSALQTASV